MNDWLDRCHFGDCLDTLRRMPGGFVHACVTSPPYFGLRDYGHEGQIGLEQTPEEFVAELVNVFREVRRVLRASGWRGAGPVLWLRDDRRRGAAPGPAVDRVRAEPGLQAAAGRAPAAAGTDLGGGSVTRPSTILICPTVPLATLPIPEQQRSCCEYMTIRVGTDAFAAAREYLRSNA